MCAALGQEIPTNRLLTVEQVETLRERAVRKDTQEKDSSWTVEWYADGKQLSVGNMTEEIYYSEYNRKTVTPWKSNK